MHSDGTKKFWYSIEIATGPKAIIERVKNKVEELFQR
jgi:hypothetical protein